MDRIAKTSIKAVVFDLDGVIVDSMPMIARGIQEVVKGFGINISADEILSTYIQPREEFYKSIGVKINNMEELYARHASAVKKHLVGARLFDDVVSTLTQLRNKGLTLGIASHQTMSNIQNEIERLGFQKFFASENALGGHKSKPEKLTELVAQFGIASHRVLFVGDLPSDITAAKKREYNRPRFRGMSRARHVLRPRNRITFWTRSQTCWQFSSIVPQARGMCILGQNARKTT